MTHKSKNSGGAIISYFQNLLTSRENQEYIKSKAHRNSQQWEIVSKLTIGHSKERKYYFSYYQDLYFSPLEFV